MELMPLPETQPAGAHLHDVHIAVPAPSIAAALQVTFESFSEPTNRLLFCMIEQNTFEIIDWNETAKPLECHAPRDGGFWGVSQPTTLVAKDLS